MRKHLDWTLAVSLACLAVPASAADSQDERASLTGLKTISIVVEELSPAAAPSGLTTSALQTSVERRVKAAGMKTRLYYVSYQGNAFDTHVQQGDVHSRLLMYTADAVRAFLDDVARIGRADDVAVMMFTEFGRRVEENGSLGTDHGTATPMFLFGTHDRIKGGFHGQAPSLTDLDDGNLKMTTDFRRVYATAIKEWLGYDDTDAILKGRFDTLGAFG